MPSSQSTTDTIQEQKLEKLRLSGMDCADCALSIQQSLGKMPGVASARVNFATSTAEITYDPALQSHDLLTRRIEELGYRVDEKELRLTPLLFSVQGMDCADCANTVEKSVGSLPDVASATISFASARLSVVPVQGASAGITAQIERTVSHAGYSATPLGQATAARKPSLRLGRNMWLGVALMCASVAFVLSLFNTPLLPVDALYALAIAAGGWTFARAGLLALKAGRADMNLLMTVAVVGAAGTGDWAEAATVVLLFGLGGALQLYTLDKTRSAINSLMSLTPDTALVRRGGKEAIASQFRDVRLLVEDIMPGETMLVGPGERIALDGLVLQGASSVNQSPITGESLPVDVEPGAVVYAGTINGYGALSVKTTQIAGRTTLAGIISMVEEAQSSRAPSQQFVDRFSAVYTPVVIAGAVLLAALPPLLFAQPFSAWFYRALVLLVVACPCALVISTPVSIVAAIGAATRRGVLIKGGATLEALARVRALAFDKTGTLTQGRPQVQSVLALSGDSNSLLTLAAAVEARSEHPLARAIVHAARALPGAQEAEARDFIALPGMGARATVGGDVVYVGSPTLFEKHSIPVMEAADAITLAAQEGRTVVLVGTMKALLGIISMSDSPRPEAANAVAMLRQAGISHVAMLTGDTDATARSIARHVGIEDVRAGLLPAGKLDAIHSLTQQYGPLAMVGDGVNDAPALAAAEVGMAMGYAGTGAALEVSGVALMSDDLSRLPFAILLSRETLRVIKWNVVLSLFVKALALLFAAVGTLPLWAAIMTDMGVSLLVTLNGMRLLAYKEPAVR
ncbi:MAG: heavy metal translocating P-type ATPase [Chloroflexota bacterium]|nr:heavy metal translocating P-type ATPase [Chloroflexota bacterium]